MDSIYAIGAGLGLRFVVDTVSRHNFKITGTLVGLWEGVILLHFLKKMPKSTDPYVAFGVRLFIDFLITESVSRLVLVLIWTGMGMVLADVAPAIWEDAGLRRIWRRLRRDLYTISETIPTVVFFPPTRTVRFSPSRESSVIEDADADADADVDAQTEPPTVILPSAVTEPDTSASNSIPLASTPADHVRRRLPGYFPGTFSDTESVLSSAVGRRRLPTTLQHDPTRTSRRQSMYPTRDYDDSNSEASNDLDDMNVSSTTSPKSTETGEPPIDFSRVTDIIPDEEEQTVQTSFQVEESVEVAVEKEEPIKGDITPRQQYPTFLPPTPTDSQATHWQRFRTDEPPVQHIPTIPDMPEETAETAEGVEDWVEIQKSDVDRPPTPPEFQKSDMDRPPTPPEKDRPRAVPQVQPSTSTADPAARSAEGGDQQSWKRPPDTMTDNANEGTSTKEANITNEQRHSQPPPPYVDTQNHDDIYGDPEDVHPRLPDTGGFPNVYRSEPPQQQPTEEEERRNQEAADEEQKNKEQEEEAERQRKAAEKEVEAQKEKELQEKVAEEERARKAAEERWTEEQVQKRKEFQERRIKEAEKRAEEERQRKADEEKRKKEEEEERRKKEEEAPREKFEKEERETAEAEKRRADLEAERQKEAERAEAEAKAEAERSRRADEFLRGEQLRLQIEEAERLRLETLEALRDEERKKKEEQEREKRQEGEAAQKDAEKEERDHEEAEDVRIREEAEKLSWDEQAAELQAARPLVQARAETSDAEGERVEALAAVEDERTGDGLLPRSQPSSEGVVDVPTSQLETPASPEQGGGEALIETGSVISERSEVPEKIGDRLDRMLLLKAQMVEMEGQIAGLMEQQITADGEAKDRIEQDLQARNKVLQKMKNKEQRRWQNGSGLPAFFCPSSR